MENNDLIGMNELQKELLGRVDVVLAALDRGDISDEQMMDALEEYYRLEAQINVQLKLAEAKLEARKRA